MAFTVLQISDMHLSRSAPPFRANLDLIAKASAALHPDLTILTGDVSRDGAGDTDDLAYAASCCLDLGVVHAVPGNHDVGDALHVPPQPVTEARLGQFRRFFGQDRWVLDHAGWRLLGLNTQIMDTGIEEDAQAGLIQGALATLGQRQLAVFMHKPPWVEASGETGFAYWTVPPASRPALLPLLNHEALRLVASGHLHLARAVVRGRVSHQWAPSAAFVVRAGDQAGLPGERVCGAVLHRFEADHVESALVTPPGLTCPLIHEVG